MRTYTTDELGEILRKHKKWLVGDFDGERASLSWADLTWADLTGANLTRANLTWADLTRANLSRANLTWADLTGANLTGADLTRANLTWADLTRANLSRANLTWADLTGANLTRADLTGANLTEANLSGADLSGANLSRANLTEANLTGVVNLDKSAGLFLPMACPDKGAFIGWKKCRDNKIVKLQIPENAMRSSSTGRKCRASEAVVLAIYDADGNPCDEARSGHDSNFLYRVGETVKPTRVFDTNRWNECAPGIHFFVTRGEAERYVL